MTRRSTERKEEAERAAQSERDAHRRVLDDAAKDAALLIAHVEKVAPTLAQIRALAEAIETAAECVSLSRRIGHFHDKVQQAAKALGVEPPKLPTMPEIPEAARRLHDALQRVGMARGGQGIG
jgi:hypothetical protein